MVRTLVENNIIAGILFVILLWFLVQIRDVLLLFFIAYILMAALSPIVLFVQKSRIPRVVAAGLVYSGVIILTIILILPLIPFFVQQITSLFSFFPRYLNDAARLFNINISTNQINSFVTSELGTIGKNAFSVTQQLFGGFFAILTVFVLSFYLLLEKESNRKVVLYFFPENNLEKGEKILKQIEDKLGSWLRGQIVLSFSIGIITWIALTILQIDFALPLALLAGLLEIVPTIGPIISSIPAIIIALTISPTLALLVAAVYIVIQILENNLLVPRIMNKAVGLSPVVIILGVIIGGKLLGVLGSLLSIPFISFLIVIYKNIRKPNKEDL